MVATIEQHTLLSLSLPLGEAVDHPGSNVEIGPAADILDDVVEFRGNPCEALFRIGFLNGNLEIAVEILPKAVREVILVDDF